jgi:hypothetical protein
MKKRRTDCRHVVLVILSLCLFPRLDAQGGAELERSWREFRAASRLFEERRFGEALAGFQSAIEARRSLSRRVVSAIESAKALPQGLRSRDSVGGLMNALAKQDITEREEEAIESAGSQSLLVRARLYARAELSPPALSLIDAYLVLAAWKAEFAESDSLQRLLEGARALEFYPEAELMLGLIYKAEGELRLAELQFQRSLSMEASFEVPDDRFLVLGELSSIWRDQRRWREYEEILAKIELSGDVWQARQDSFRSAMTRSLLADGFDRFMLLYRLEDGPWMKASLSLGEFYLERGRSAPALERLAVAANAVVSILVDRIAFDDIDYTYADLRGFLGKVAGTQETRAYAEGSGLYRALVLLGEALWYQGQGRDKALELWRSVSARPEAGEWAARAARNLRTPPAAVNALP